MSPAGTPYGRLRTGTESDAPARAYHAGDEGGTSERHRHGPLHGPGGLDLLSRLGDAAFDEIRRTHFAARRQALSRHGGEEVKTLGDGVLAVFGSAADAVSCAVTIEQAVDRRSRSGSAPLSVRVGLALGDVSFEEEDVFGTPVVEAAPLAAAAGPGQILAALGSRRFHSTSSGC